MARDNVIDPAFHFPTGVEGFRYKEEHEFGESEFNPEDSEEFEAETEEFSGSDLISTSDDLYEDGALPFPPDYITVVSQEVRTLPGGGQVVDVILELPDLTVGDKYDIRVTKV